MSQSGKADDVVERTREQLRAYGVTKLGWPGVIQFALIFACMVAMRIFGKWLWGQF